MILKQPLPAAILLLLSSSLLACSPKTPKTGDAPGSVSDTTQYSVRNFIRGQVITHYGLPIVVERRLQSGDRVDSSFIPIAEADWNEIIPVFAKTDISDPALNGQYSFSIADDNITASRILTYTALRPDLFTQTFQINTDPLNFKVKSIYIETRSSGFWRKASQKLLYISDNIIQIQETIDPLIGATTQRRLEYRFPGDPSNDVHIVEEEQ